MEWSRNGYKLSEFVQKIFADFLAFCYAKFDWASTEISEKNCALHAEWNAQLAVLWFFNVTHYYPQND